MNNQVFGVSNKLWKTFGIGVLIVLFMLVAYASSLAVMIIPAALSCVYIIAVKSDEKCTVIIMFLLVFSGIFKISVGSTSLFFLCKIAFVFRMLINQQFKVKKISLLFFTISFVLYCTINSMFFSTDASIRIINIVLWIIVSYGLLGYIKQNINQLLELFMFTFLFSCIIAALAVFIPKLSATIMSAETYYDPGYGNITRYSGIFGDPNMTTVMIILSLFICLRLFNARVFKTLSFLFFSFILTGLGIYTGSKSCFLLLIVFWSYYIFGKTSNKILKMIMIVVAIVLITVFTSTSLYDYYYYRFFGAASGITTGRSDIWITYIDSLNERGDLAWLFGLGINTPLLPNGRAAHNLFIQVIYNIGIFGLLLYTLTMFSYSRCALRVTLFSEMNIRKRLGSLFPLLCLFSTVLFLDTLFIEIYYFLFAICLAIAIPENKRDGM